MKVRILVLALATALIGASVATAKGKPSPTGDNCRPRVSFILKGTLTSLGTDSFHMNVVKANRHGRAFLGDREIKVSDMTRFRRMGHATMADLVLNDRLKVQVRGCKHGDPATMELLAKRVVAHPAPAEH
jgi:hypothetical protein